MKFALAGVNLQLHELFEVLEQGHYPIVYVRTHLNQASLSSQHAYVIKLADQKEIVALAPWQRERALATAEFERE